MIARMSKVEIVGPKDALQDVLVLLQKLNVFQIEPEAAELIERGGGRGKDQALSPR